MAVTCSVKKVTPAGKIPLPMGGISSLSATIAWDTNSSLKVLPAAGLSFNGNVILGYVWSGVAAVSGTRAVQMLSDTKRLHSSHFGKGIASKKEFTAIINGYCVGNDSAHGYYKKSANYSVVFTIGADHSPWVYPQIVYNDANENVQTAFPGKLIQGKSKINIAKKNSTEYECMCQAYAYLTDVAIIRDNVRLITPDWWRLQTEEDNDLQRRYKFEGEFIPTFAGYLNSTTELFVKDSRGYTATGTPQWFTSQEATESVNPYIYGYEDVEIRNVYTFRCNQDGTENPDGGYYKITTQVHARSVKDIDTNDEANSATLTLNINGTDETPITIPLQTSAEGIYEYSVIKQGSNDEIFDIILTLADALTKDQESLTVEFGKPLIDFGAGGKSVGIGHIAEGQEKVTIGWDTSFKGKVQHMDDIEVDADINVTGNYLKNGVKTETFRSGVITKKDDGSATSTPAGSYTDFTVNFDFEYEEPPIVVAALQSASTSGNMGKTTVGSHSITTTGAKVRFFNGDSATRAPYIMWMAVGK